jgi:hypothetical protein
MLTKFAAGRFLVTGKPWGNCPTPFPFPLPPPKKNFGFSISKGLQHLEDTGRPFSGDLALLNIDAPSSPN